MANILPTEKKHLIVAALAEGSSIRSIERMTGVHRDSIMRLGVKVGTACTQMMDTKLRNLACNKVQIDEIWGFVGKKQRSVTDADAGKFVGDVWTFVALDSETKLVPSFVTGKRDFAHTHNFVSDLASRMKNRIQLTSDGMDSYAACVEDAFGSEIDFGQIVKTFGTDVEGQRRYSPPVITGIRKTVLAGKPDPAMISTSHIESQNLTIRMHVRRLTRLTNAFSKKFENFQAAMGLHFAYYNFCKRHCTIRCTPAQEAGIEASQWTVSDLVELA